MTVIWGKKAYNDLDGIVNYLADLSPEAAYRAVCSQSSLAKIMCFQQI